MSTTLESFLKVIGLESYHALLVDNGYDDPDIILELSEDDLVSVGVKRGHAKRAFLKVKEILSSGGVSQPSSSSSSSTPSASSPTAPAAQPSKSSSSRRVTIGKKDDESDSDSEASPAITMVSEGSLQSRVLYEGFLSKKGDVGFLGSKVWAKRWFKVYEEGKLAYFKQQQDVSPINVIELRGSLACEDLDGKPLAFRLSMKTSARVYYLLAPSNDVKVKWMQVLKPLITPPVTPKKIDPLAIRPYVQNTEDPPQSSSSRFDAKNTWDVEDRANFAGDTRLHVHSSGPLYVEETRRIVADESGAVWIGDLPRGVEERSVHFFSLTEPAAFVAEQTFHDDPKAPTKMLERLIGREIEVSAPRDKHFGAESKFKGRLHYNARESSFALVDAEANTVHFLAATEGITFELLNGKLPADIFRGPALEWTLAAKERDHLAKISYNASRVIKWHATYVAILNPRETQMELRGWFTVKNKSGKTFTNANLVLIREPEPEKKVEEAPKSDTSIALPVPKLGGLFGKISLPGLLGGSAKPDPVPEPRIHRYNVEGRTTVVDNESKQICFVSTRIPVRSVDYITFATPKYTKYAAVNKEHGSLAKGRVDSAVIFQWEGKASIPAGKITLQRQNKDGFGSDVINVSNIDHHNPSDIILLPLQSLGKVTTSRVQTGFNFDIDNLYMVETFEIKVVNGREEPVNIVLEESLYRWEYFEITYASQRQQPHPTHPRKITWSLSIAPLDHATINYSVFYSGMDLPESLLPKKEPIVEIKKK
eukprot:gene11487-13396_t